MEGPDADEPDVDAPDPIVGLWRSIEVTDVDMFSYTVEFGMTIEEDLTGQVAASIFYDYPGTMYDENYDYTLTLTAEALGSAKYRINFRNPTDPPERPDFIVTCTLTGTTLVCDPDDEAVPENLTYERQD